MLNRGLIIKQPTDEHDYKWLLAWAVELVVPEHSLNFVKTHRNAKHSRPDFTVSQMFWFTAHPAHLSTEDGYRTLIVAGVLQMDP